jgi:hypothetical protein
MILVSKREHGPVPCAGARGLTTSVYFHDSDASPADMKNEDEELEFSNTTRS